MNGRFDWTILVVLVCVGGATFSPMILADAPVADEAQVVAPGTAAVSVKEQPQTALSSDTTGSRGIKREIRELHEEVRVLRRDVNRLIELLQNRPTEANPDVNPDPTADSASESESPNPLPVSDPQARAVWELTLNNAVRIALQNSKALRSLGNLTSAFDNTDTLIVTSRLNSDMETTKIAIATSNLASNVEELYWKLWTAHHDLKSAREARDSAQKVWKVTWERYNNGVASALDKAQADQQYFIFRSAVEQASHNLQQHDLRLRHALGLAQFDGRQIHPTDEPSTAKVKLDWNEAQANALTNGLELIQQRRVIEQCECELATARKELPEALANLATEDVPSQSGMPDRQRRALATMKTRQLSLAREKARLEEMELTTSHQHSNALRQLDSSEASAQTHLAHATAAKAELKSATDLYLSGKGSLAELLDAQRRLAQSMEAYHAAIGEQAIAVKDVHLQRGTLLQHRGVKLADGISSGDTDPVRRR